MTSTDRVDLACWHTEREWRRTCVAFDELILELQSLYSGRATMRDLLVIARHIKAGGPERRRGHRSLAAIAGKFKDADVASILSRYAEALTRALEAMEEATAVATGRGR